MPRNPPPMPKSFRSEPSSTQPAPGTLPRGLRVAIVHDWFCAYGGAERVVEQMLQVLPQADLFALVDFLPEQNRAMFGGRDVRTSFVQRLPRARTKYRSYLPVMTFAVEQFDLSKYDLVVSSSSSVAKGVLTGPDQCHVCMCYSPMRYAWDLQHQYLREAGLERRLGGALARYILHHARLWDVRTANGVDQFIAISKFIARRIRKAYQRDSVVVYPPVDVAQFTPSGNREGFYVTASRMVPYKRTDLIVQAFASMPTRQLIVIGDGPEMARIRKIAAPNVTLLGHQPFSILRDYLRRARAFVFAAEEDFGIAPIEAQACGTPVIAYGKGGALETIIAADGAEPTGRWFDEQTPEALCQAVHEFEQDEPISPEACRANAMRFAPERFRQEFRHVLEQALRGTTSGAHAEAAERRTW